MHSSRCVPPSAALPTILAPLRDEGKDFGVIAAQTPMPFAGKATSALVVSCSAPVGVIITYDANVNSPEIWVPAGTTRIYPRAPFLGAIMSPFAANTRVSAWREDVNPQGPWNPPEDESDGAGGGC